MKRKRILLSVDDELYNLIKHTKAMGKKDAEKVTNILRAYFSEGSVIRDTLKKVLKIKK